MPRTALRAAAYMVTGVGAAMAGAGAALFLASPAIESRLWPVAINWRAEAVREVGGATVLNVRSRKIRSCKYLGEDVSIRPPGGDARDVESRWDDDPTPGSTRPLGQLDLGSLRVFTTRATPVGSDILVVMRHQCHAGPETLTHVEGHGFIVPPLPAQ